jgi:DNA-binding MarR family transcriptional regulator
VSSPSLPRADSLGYLVNHAARLFARALHHEIAALGVVPGQFAQLLALFEQDGISQQELCERVQIEQPTMAATLKRMERDGLVVREPDPDDRRRARILLTDRARELEPALTAAARRVNAAALEGLDADATAALLASLESMRGSLHWHLRDDEHDEASR